MRLTDSCSGWRHHRRSAIAEEGAGTVADGGCDVPPHPSRRAKVSTCNRTNPEGSGLAGSEAFRSRTDRDGGTANAEGVPDRIIAQFRRVDLRKQEPEVGGEVQVSEEPQVRAYGHVG